MHKLKPKQTSNTFRFRKHSSIGAPDAESDSEFLEHCFIDIGDLEVLRDTDSPKRIVLGRTGSGKSALLRELVRREEHVVELNPQALALNHVANSNIVQFLEAAGVNLDSFYQLLWKHVLAIELLSMKFSLSSGNSQPLWEIIKDGLNQKSTRRKAIDYVEQWAPKFWLESEFRVKEITQKFEENAKADFKGRIDVLEIGVGGGRALSEELKAEVVTKGQRVVNELQLQELAELIRLLGEEIFVDPQQKYFVVIDTLDENWVDDRIKLKLIRALLEVARSFQKVRQVKIIVALRIDLIRRVFNRTRDSGFQEEKFEGLSLNVGWRPANIRQMLEERINYLIRRDYTSTKLTFEDIFPNRVGGYSAFDYIVDRTLLRPRDAISFVNECLSLVEGKTTVNSATVKQAEGVYSHGRMDALVDEWIADYPCLKTYTKFIAGKPSRLKLSEFSKAVVESYIVDVCSDLPEGDFIYRTGQDVMDGKKTPHAFVIEMVKILYGVGLLGVKPEAYAKFQWAFDPHASLSDGQIKPSASIEIHPAYSRALGVRSV